MIQLQFEAGELLVQICLQSLKNLASDVHGTWQQQKAHLLRESLVGMCVGFPLLFLLLSIHAPAYWMSPPLFMAGLDAVS